MIKHHKSRLIICAHICPIAFQFGKLDAQHIAAKRSEMYCYANLVVPVLLCRLFGGTEDLSSFVLASLHNLIVLRVVKEKLCRMTASPGVICVDNVWVSGMSGTSDYLANER